MKKKTLLTLCAALGTSILLFAGCGSGSTANSTSTASRENISYDSATAETAEYEYGYSEEATGDYSEYETDTDYEYSDVSEDAATERKLIRTVDMSVETTSYDSALSAIKAQVSESGGYVEYIYTYNGSSYSSYTRPRSWSLTLRMPSENLDVFLTAVSDICNVVYSDETVTDVTLTYVDLESRILILETEQERLIALLEEAESLEDILTIEERLSEVQYQLESKESQKRTYDNQINYSTVTMYLREVQVLTPTAELTVWQRISQGFEDSVESICEGISEAAIWVIIHIPYLVILGAVILIAVLLIKRRCRKSSGKIKKQNTVDAAGHNTDHPDGNGGNIAKTGKAPTDKKSDET
ncbi:MAG: DUF4349 domain-containing protein [Lachnospiraceae bacterium]|nr:DUF4349 domain-containing protein [Lachnospiraceae bacterium]